jgi:hypothetical protein
MPIPRIVLVLAATSSFALAQGCLDSNYGTALGLGDEVVFPIQPIGFAFPLAGATYTDVHVCTNGYVTLSNGGVPAAPPSDYTATTAEFVAGPPRIAALWNDLHALAQSGGQVYINSTPAKCTITWDKINNYASGTAAGPVMTFQAQLFPTGEVAFVYSSNATNNSSITTGQPAIVGATPGLGAVLPGASDLSLPGSTPDTTVFELWPSPLTFDIQGQTLQLIPGTPGWVHAATVPANCASTYDYGVGCLDIPASASSPDSFYEVFTAAQFDLANTTITMLRTGAGYVVLNNIPGTFVTPTASAQVLANADDTTQTVALSAALPLAGGSTTSLTISSNGNVAGGQAPGNGALYTPAITTFLNWAQASFACWHDYNPAATGSGKILFEEIAGVAYVTWNGVYSFNTSSPDTFQFQFDLATGNVTMLFGAMAPSGGSYLVGYSRAGASPDPGALDLSTALVSGTTLYDPKVPLAMTSNGRPYLGNTTWSLDVRNVPNLVALGIVLWGDVQILPPGFDLSGIGMPGCVAYTNANVLSTSFPVSLPAGTGSLQWSIPVDMNLLGVTVSTQCIAFSLDTPLNLIASNGTMLSFGW